MNALPAARLLRDDGSLVDADPWHLLREPEGFPADAARQAPMLLPLSAYLHAPASDHVGVWLAPDDDVLALQSRLDRLQIVAIDFPKFADGRGFSLASRLRTRLQYRGDLRAVGEVLVDQLAMLRRVGFSSFALRADQSLDHARRALQRPHHVYQASADGRTPAFLGPQRAAA